MNLETISVGCETGHVVFDSPLSGSPWADRIDHISLHLSASPNATFQIMQDDTLQKTMIMESVVYILICGQKCRDSPTEAKVWPVSRTLDIWPTWLRWNYLPPLPSWGCTCDKLMASTAHLSIRIGRSGFDAWKRRILHPAI